MLCTLALLLGLTQPVIPDDTKLEDPTVEVDIAGNYRFTDDNMGDPKRGVAVIIKKKDSYFIRWAYESGEQAMGVGMREGNQFYVSWTQGTVLGICRYRIELRKDQPHLVGERGTTEVMTFVE
jgi:hypothetical protein